jgi:tetratricopeptide (TPR) repeat protein
LAEKFGPQVARRDDFQASLVMAYMNSGMSALHTGRVSEAPPLLDQAREIQERLVAARPGEVGRVVALAQVYRNYVYLALLTDDPDRALEMSEKAVGLIDQLTPTQRAENWLLEAEVGSIHFETGTVLFQEARFKDARDRFDRAADSFARVLKKIPAQPNVEPMLRGTLAGRIQVNLALGKYDDALRDCDGFEKLGKKGEALLPRATALAGKGDHRTAVAMLVEAGSDKDRGDKDRQFELAGFYAVAARAVRDDPRLDPAEKRALVRKYAGTAVHMLTTLAENNYFRKKQRLAALTGHRSFDAVRSLPEVTQLIAEAEGS